MPVPGRRWHGSGAVRGARLSSGLAPALLLDPPSPPKYHTAGNGTSGMGADATPPAGSNRPLSAVLSAAVPLVVLVRPLRSFCHRRSSFKSVQRPRICPPGVAKNEGTDKPGCPCPGLAEQLSNTFPHLRLFHFILAVRSAISPELETLRTPQSHRVSPPSAGSPGRILPPAPNFSSFGLSSCPPRRRLFSPRFGVVRGKTPSMGEFRTPASILPRRDSAPDSSRKSLGPRGKRGWGFRGGLRSRRGGVVPGLGLSPGEKREGSSGHSAVQKTRNSPRTRGTPRLRVGTFGGAAPWEFWGSSEAPPPLPPRSTARSGSAGASRLWLRSARFCPGKCHSSRIKAGGINHSSVDHQSNCVQMTPPFPT